MSLHTLPCSLTRSGRIAGHAGKALGELHPLLRNLTNDDEVSVSNVSALGHDSTEIDRRSLDSTDVTGIVPFPNRPRGCEETHVRLRTGDFQTADGKAPLKRTNSDDGDILDAIAQGTSHAREIVDVLTVGPGFHETRGRMHAHTHVRTEPGQPLLGIQVSKLIGHCMTVGMPALDELLGSDLTEDSADEGRHCSMGLGLLDCSAFLFEGLMAIDRRPRRHVEVVEVRDDVPRGPLHEGSRTRPVIGKKLAQKGAKLVCFGAKVSDQVRHR